MLTELSVRGIDLTRIESRPIKGRRNEYWFHLDCGGHVAQPAMGEAVAALYRRCTEVRYLGSYPRAASPGGTGTEPGTGPGSGQNAAPGSGQDAEPVRGHDVERFLAAQAWLEDVRAGRRA